mmetsp:Transcript_26235/g.23087  ORF Transcript_26235/g.23087 Transcript_26235/m.23087 type:complete len:126 (-) Transcript_26235:13-390(-)
MKDARIAVDLVCNALLGNTTLYHFAADSESDILKTGFIETFNPIVDTTDPEALNLTMQEIKRVLKINPKEDKNKERKDLVEKAENYINAYYNSMKSHFSLDSMKLFSPLKKKNFIEVVEICNLIL